MHELQLVTCLVVDVAAGPPEGTVRQIIVWGEAQLLVLPWWRRGRRRGWAVVEVPVWVGWCGASAAGCESEPLHSGWTRERARQARRGPTRCACAPGYLTHRGVAAGADHIIPGPLHSAGGGVVADSCNVAIVLGVPDKKIEGRGLEGGDAGVSRVGVEIGQERTPPACVCRAAVRLQPCTQPLTAAQVCARRWESYQ